MPTPTEPDITDDERGIRDAGRFEAEEADSRGTLDRAGVRSIIRSGPRRGRLVYDPERRFTPMSLPSGDQNQTSGQGTNEESRSHAGLRTRTGKRLRITPKAPEQPKQQPVQSVDEAECWPPRRRGYGFYRHWKESTIHKVKELRPLIELESGTDPVLAAAIAGSFAEEFDGLGPVDAVQSEIISRYSEDELREWRARVNLYALVEEKPSYRRFIDKMVDVRMVPNPNPTRDPKLELRKGNPFKNDLGPANFNLATAVWLWEEGRLSFSNLDSRAPLTGIVRQLQTDSGSVTAVAADIRWAKAELQKLGVFSQALACLQEGYLVSWFNQGPRFGKKITEKLAENPRHIPQPNNDGEAYMQNRKRILRALELAD